MHFIVALEYIWYFVAIYWKKKHSSRIRLHGNAGVLVPILRMPHSARSYLLLDSEALPWQPPSDMNSGLPSRGGQWTQWSVGYLIASYGTKGYGANEKQPDINCIWHDDTICRRISPQTVRDGASRLSPVVAHGQGTPLTEAVGLWMFRLTEVVCFKLRF